MRYLRLVDIDRKINVMIYDEKEKAWKEHRMSIGAFLDSSSKDHIPVITAEGISAILENGEVKLKTLNVI